MEISPDRQEEKLINYRGTGSDRKRISDEADLCDGSKTSMEKKVFSDADRLNRKNRTDSGKRVFSVTAIAFTERAGDLAQKVKTYWSEKAELALVWREETKITEEIFLASDLLIFFCAAGIAVRKIAPFVKEYPVPEKGEAYYLCKGSACFEPQYTIKDLKEKMEV